MKVRPDQCGIPKCKGCGKHLNHEHEPDCIILVAEAYRMKNKRAA
jgi:hypothetical protein